MTFRRLSISLLAGALACGPASPLRAEVSLASGGGVTTFAGSGIAGNEDGPVASATFSAPASIAVAPDGDVYVADKAVDTIRLIRSGVVTTIVGAPTGDRLWRAGGYRDGPAADARLNHPEAIAVAPDGSLAIADTWNACIRRYANGIVTTIAGAPTRFGSSDGDGPTVASFKNPKALAIDARGAIYVGDRENPIRKIDPNGVVSSLTVKTMGIVLGLATALPDKLYVSDEGGLLETNTVPGTIGRRLTNGMNVRAAPSVEAGAPLGHPSALAAVDDRAVAYTDLTDDSIHVAVVTRVDRVAGAPQGDPNEAGGYRDGPPLGARFNGPAAIARYGAGWLVADSGNHRIRYLPGFDTRNAVSPNDLAELDAYVARKRTRLLVIGNSEVWFDTTYANSIAGRLQPLLPAFDVVPVSLVGVDDPALIGNWLAEGYDVKAPAQVLYVFNDVGITDHGHKLYADLMRGGPWTHALSASLASLRARCHGARLTVVDIPVGSEASPSETAFAQRIFSSTSSEWEHIGALHARVAAAARASGVRYVDLWPAFRAIDAAGRGPLFHPFDSHLSAIGRTHLARLIAATVSE